MNPPILKVALVTFAKTSGFKEHDNPDSQSHTCPPDTFMASKPRWPLATLLPRYEPVTFAKTPDNFAR
jgi:hypothetical protein